VADRQWRRTVSSRRFLEQSLDLGEDLLLLQDHQHQDYYQEQYETAHDAAYKHLFVPFKNCLFSFPSMGAGSVFCVTASTDPA